MKPWVSVITIGLSTIAATAAVVAQDSSLEQTYTSMCAGKAEPETEACSALKEALLHKLRVSTAAEAKESPDKGMQPAATAVAKFDARWGLLAELAERDLLVGGLGSVPATIRWEVPNHSLIWIDWLPVQRGTTRVTLHSSSGDLVATSNMWPSARRLVARPNGDLHIVGESEPFLRRHDKRGYSVRWSRGYASWYAPLEGPSDKNEKLRNLIAAGKVRAANPAQIEMAAGAASLRPRPPESKVQVASAPASTAAISPDQMPGQDVHAEAGLHKPSPEDASAVLLRQQRSGNTVDGLWGGTWVDTNADGTVDGFFYMSAYHEGVPSAALIATGAQNQKWGVLAWIVGNKWYCVGGNPRQWFQRKRIESGYGYSFDRSSPVIRLTEAEWLQPYRSMKVTTKLGDGRGWTDTITINPDGSFQMASEGVSNFAQLRGYLSNDGKVTFPLGSYTFGDWTQRNTLTFHFESGSPVYELSGGTYGDKATCFMQQITTPEQAESFRKYFITEQDAFFKKEADIPSREADAAADRARGERMAANMQAGLIGTIMSGGGSGPVAYFPSTSSITGVSGSAFFQQLEAMAEGVQQAAEQSRRELDATISGALVQGSSKSSTLPSRESPSGTNVLANSTAASGSVGTRGNAEAKALTSTRYYDCFGVIKKRTGAGDVVNTIFYGIVTSSREDIDAAEDMFRQHTASDQASGTENSGASCHPYNTREEAVSSRDRRISRDSRGNWRQVTNIELSM